MQKRLFLLIFLLSVSTPLLANPLLAKVEGPRVLIVDAHPDDEGAFAGAVYKIQHDLHGTIDLVVITDGEGGYKYSTLAEPYYHLKLTDEKIGRKYLPHIRHDEMVRAGKIIGLHHIYFLNQRDNRYTLDPHEVLDSNWNIPYVKSTLRKIMLEGHYDFIFMLLPVATTHGHHKAAAILTLTVLKSLPSNIPHPIALGIDDIDSGKTPAHFTELSGFPITHCSDGAPSYSFDRRQSFGFHHALNYKIIVNWDIAEHKSQGTEQLGMNRGDLEEYYYFDVNPPEGRAKAKALFDKLAVNYYPELTYPGVK